MGNYIRPFRDFSINEEEWRYTTVEVRSVQAPMVTVEYLKGNSMKNLSRIEISSARVKHWNEPVVNDLTSIEDGSFHGFTMVGTDFRGVDIEGCSFSHATMRHAILTTSIHDSSFYGADLANAEMAGGDFYASSFERAIMQKVDARGANFDECLFAGADLTGMKIDDDTTFVGAKRITGIMGIDISEVTDPIRVFCEGNDVGTMSDLENLLGSAEAAQNLFGLAKQGVSEFTDNLISRLNRSDRSSKIFGRT
jgi:hypothetical protein